MKYLAVFLLVVVATCRADPLDEYLLAEDDAAADGSSFVKCHKDLYNCKKGDKGFTTCLGEYKNCIGALVPTIPPFIAQCKKLGKSCIHNAGSWKERGQCIIQYAKCMINKGPISPAPEVSFDDNVPERGPFVQCQIDAYDCANAGKAKMGCLKEYETCVAALIPTIPPFVIACNEKRKTCMSKISGWRPSAIIERAMCTANFGKCIITLGHFSRKFDADEKFLEAFHDVAARSSPFLQCFGDHLKCLGWNFQQNKQCVLTLVECAKQNRPTVPPYAAKCSVEFKTAVSKATTFYGLYKCVPSYYTCLRNGWNGGQ